MVQRTRRQISTYVDRRTFDRATAAAHTRQVTVSAYVAALIESDLTSQQTPLSATDALLIKILISVDALLMHHPKNDLLGIVKRTRDKRIEGASNEA